MYVIWDETWEACEDLSDFRLLYNIPITITIIMFDNADAAATPAIHPVIVL